MEKIICIYVSLLMVPAFADKCNNLDLQQPLQPCAPYNNWNCIRSYFAGSHCRLQTCVEISDVLNVQRDIVLYPYFNMTGTQSNVKISGLNSGEIVAFIVDYHTDVMQITTRFTNLTITSDTTINYLQPFAEPLKIYFPSALVRYSELFVITVFNTATAPDLRNSYTLANTVVPADYDLGVCELPENQPELIQELIKFFSKRREIDGPEGLLLRSPIININFIQEAICNFGIDTVNGPESIGPIE